MTKKLVNKVILQQKSNKIELTIGQSPRGLRFKDKRANHIRIDCCMHGDKTLLGKYISWLNDIYVAMD